MNSAFKKFTVGLLAVMMVISLIPGSVLGTVAEGAAILLRASDAEPVYILAGSDFQPEDGNTTAGVTAMRAILDKIEGAGYTDFDGFLFAGDYSVNYDEQGCVAGKNAVQSTVQSYFGTDMHEIYVKGNHDPDSMVGSSLPASGANDPASGDYGVFVIHEMDYMWFNDDPATIQKTAAALKAYLDAKYISGFDEPIFVVSHLPLHYSLRTQVGGGDGRYAKYIFDVLQEAGEKGLNVFFLFGHDHSHGWDDYIGGAAIYLAEGDSINIAKEGSTSKYTTETLQFTYMNAGYTGYYHTSNSGASTELTMTVIKIEDGEATVERFSANGKTNLKAAGVLNTSHHYGTNGGCCNQLGTESYSANTHVHVDGSITLNSLEEPSTMSSGAVTVTAPGLTELAVQEGTPSTDDVYYTITYDLTATTLDGDYSDIALVTIALPDAFKGASMLRLSATVDGKACSITSWKNGKLTLLASGRSTITVSYKMVISTAKIYYERLSSVDDIVSGETYLILYVDLNKYVKPVLTADSSKVRHGFDMQDNDRSSPAMEVVEGWKPASMEWIITATGNQWYIGVKTKNAKFYTDGTRVGLGLDDAGTEFEIISNNGVFNISALHNNKTYYWQYNQTGDLINGYASGPSPFYIYKKVINQPESEPETTVPEVDTTVESDTTIELDTTLEPDTTLEFETTVESDTTAQPGATAESGTTAEPETTPAAKKGCGSAIGTGTALASLIVAAGALVLRKKRED